jgi:hypothetical protein
VTLACVLRVLGSTLPAEARRRSLARIRHARHCTGNALGTDGVRVRDVRIDPPREGDQVGVVPGVLDAHGIARLADPHGCATVAQDGFQIERSRCESTSSGSS